MCLSLTEIEVAMARHQKRVVTAERAVRTAGVDRSMRRPVTNPWRRSVGAALVCIGGRLHGCPIPCGS